MGLDASSKTIGLCIIDYNNKSSKLIHQEYYKPPKKGNLFERLAQVSSFIEEKMNEFGPDCCAIEDILLHMGGKKCPVCKRSMGGASTAKTITTLAVFNRTVGLTIFNEFEKPPYLYNAMRIRHAIKKDKKLPSKEDMPELVSDILKFSFPYEYKKKRDGSTELREENFDMADAIAVALCHIKMDREGKADELQKKKKRKKRKKRKKKK